MPSGERMFCVNLEAKPVAHEAALGHGWFFHPWSFEPRWVKDCEWYESCR